MSDFKQILKFLTVACLLICYKIIHFNAVSINRRFFLFFHGKHISSFWTDLGKTWKKINTYFQRQVQELDCKSLQPAKKKWYLLYLLLMQTRLSDFTIQFLRSEIFCFSGFTSDLYSFGKHWSFVQIAWICPAIPVLYGEIWTTLCQWHSILVSHFFAIYFE